MVTQPGARFGIAKRAVVVTFRMASAARVDSTQTGRAVVLAAGLLAAGLLGAGLALSPSMTAALGVPAWGWFTGFVEPRPGELSIAGDDLQRLVVFTVSTVALAVFVRRIHQVIKENSHG